MGSTIRRDALDHPMQSDGHGNWYTEVKAAKAELCFDSTLYFRNVRERGSSEVPDGWCLLQAFNQTVSRHLGSQITVAEDLQGNVWITKEVGAGGVGFGSQWDPHFVRPNRAAVIASQNQDRSL